MEFKEFPQLQEKLYFEELENGLKVYLLPKPGFNKSFATFTTKYGSIDNEFVPIGQSEMKRVQMELLISSNINYLKNKTMMFLKNSLHIVPRQMLLLHLRERVIYFLVQVNYQRI